MTEQQERLAREREEIASRVASFKATQEKFEREREEYYVTTLSERMGWISAGRRSGPDRNFLSVTKKPGAIAPGFSRHHWL